MAIKTSKAITITNEEALEANYFISEGFQASGDPMYEELTEILETVKHSPIFVATRRKIFYEGQYIADDISDAFSAPENALYTTLSRVEYFKQRGSLYVRMGGICNLVLESVDGWDKEILERFARIASKCIIGCAARDMRNVLVHKGVYLGSGKSESEYRSEYWSGKGINTTMSVSEYVQTHKKFAIMGITRINNPRVKLERDEDGFVFEDRHSSDYWLAEHNTLHAGMLEDDTHILAYSHMAHSFI